MTVASTHNCAAHALVIRYYSFNIKNIQVEGHRDGQITKARVRSQQNIYIPA